MLERRRKEEMRKEGFRAGDEGLDHWTRQSVAVKSRSDTTDVKKERETDVEIEFFGC